MARRYTGEQREWLLLHFADMTNRELAAAFEERFGTPTTYGAMHSFGSNRHLRKGPGVARRALAAYTAEENEFLREFVPGHTRVQISREFEARFGRPLSKGQICGIKTRLGVRQGVNAGRFERGRPNPNKGRTWDEMGISDEGQERMRANLFRKGELNEYNRGRMRSLLDTKDGPDGILMIYVRPRNARHPSNHWISYARFVWMQANGQDWPEGCRAIFADHDNHNFDPDNVVPVPNDLAVIVCGGAHGHAMPYHDRESLEVALNHARVMRARGEAQRRLRGAGSKASAE